MQAFLLPAVVGLMFLSLLFGVVVYIRDHSSGGVAGKVSAKVEDTLKNLLPANGIITPGQAVDVALQLRDFLQKNIPDLKAEELKFFESVGTLAMRASQANKN